MKIITIVAAVLVLGSSECGPKPVPPNPLDIPVQTKTVVEEQKNDLWTVTLEGEFNDDKSYYGVRRIYRLKHKDGTEIVGVTGVGVIEYGSHKAGKTTVQDER